MQCRRLVCVLLRAGLLFLSCLSCYNIIHTERVTFPLFSALLFEKKMHYDAMRMRMQAATKEADSVPVLTVSDTQSFYVCSLSSRTIVYKGQLSPEQVTFCILRIYIICSLWLQQSRSRLL